jgi:hypothetical protein
MIATTFGMNQADFTDVAWLALMERGQVRVLQGRAVRIDCSASKDFEIARLSSESRPACSESIGLLDEPICEVVRNLKGFVLVEPVLGNEAGEICAIDAPCYIVTGRDG